MNEIIDGCFDSEVMATTRGRKQQASNVSDRASEADISRQNSPLPALQVSKRKGKQTKMKDCNEKILQTLEKLANRIDDIDKRLERQEKMAPSISLSQPPSAHSSPKATSTHGSIQAEVERRVQEYQNVPRGDDSGMCNSKPIKSGRYRLGDRIVKHVVRWPHKSVSLDGNFRMPSYDEHLH